MHACYAVMLLAYAAMDDNGALASGIDDNSTCMTQSVRNAYARLHILHHMRACTICENVFGRAMAFSCIGVVSCVRFSRARQLLRVYMYSTFHRAWRTLHLTSRIVFALHTTMVNSHGGRIDLVSPVCDTSRAWVCARCCVLSEISWHRSEPSSNCAKPSHGSSCSSLPYPPVSKMRLRLRIVRRAEMN